MVIRVDGQIVETLATRPRQTELRNFLECRAAHLRIHPWHQHQAKAAGEQQKYVSHRPSRECKRLFGGNVFQGRSDSTAHRFRAAHTPEVHEKQARLFGKHVAMERRNQDMVCLEFGYDRVYLVRGEHEVAGGSDIAGVGGLKIDGFPYTRGWGYGQAPHLWWVA